jgi:hypothetical protein
MVSINSSANSLGAGSYSDTVTFTNTTNGNGNTTRGVSLTVQASSYGNIASLATVTASSETPAYGQLAIKAVDGHPGGYPGDVTQEWASRGERAGAWLRLSWALPYLVDRVVLYDRPNTADQITAATLTFSDGSTVSVGPLNNTGVATAYSFTPRVTTSLTMRVDQVSSSTGNVGLSEIEVYGVAYTGTQYTLTVNVNPLGSGLVSRNPDKATYFVGEQVALTATANSGYSFSNWSGDGSGTEGSTVITMNSDKTVVANFVVTPGTLSVTPGSGLSASGNQGGPFSPSSVAYTVQNTGGATIGWSASKTAAWVDLSSSGGSLGAGASATVTVSINSSANSLGAGSYSDTVTFTNTTNGNGNGTRGVSLTVQAVSPGVLSVTPASGLSASGNQGGPFSPTSVAYTVQNTGGLSIAWSASRTAAWVDLSSSGGSLAAGASTTVTVSINSSANSLGAGSYSDTVTFTNTTNGSGNTTRGVSLTVQAVSPGVLSVTPASGLSASGIQGGPFSPTSVAYTVQNTGGAAIGWTASRTAAWVDLSSSGGSLAAGASTTVTVSINSNANSLVAGSYSDTVTFTNTTNGSGNTARGVSLTVQASSYGNIASLATVTASTETPAFDQLAIKAVDGVIDGYPGDHTREWASRGERAGAWLRLSWAVPYLVDRVVLYDRPNTADQITAATLTFSDGSTVSVGPLNNTGAATTYSFTPRVITSLTMRVDQVSSSTINVGLSEIEVFGVRQ